MSTKNYRVGDLLITHNMSGRHRQKRLEFVPEGAAIIVGREKYISQDPSDSQSLYPADIRWLILQDGSLLYCTDAVLDLSYDRW